MIQRLRFTNPDDGPHNGLQCKVDPELELWVGKDVMKRIRNAVNNIFNAANPPGGQRRLNADQIVAKMGLSPDEGGFDPAASRRIAESLNHMLKHMMWAFDLVEMRENNYAHFVPADRYRFARMLGLVPNGKIPLEFDIISTDGPNKGQKTGVWKGTLDQLSDEKGDQRRIPNKMECEVLLCEIFGDKEVQQKTSLLRLQKFAVRECFANENVDLRARYREALRLSS